MKPYGKRNVGLAHLPVRRGRVFIYAAADFTVPLIFIIFAKPVLGGNIFI